MANEQGSRRIVEDELEWLWLRPLIISSDGSEVEEEDSSDDEEDGGDEENGGDRKEDSGNGKDMRKNNALRDPFIITVNALRDAFILVMHS